MKTYPCFGLEFLGQCHYDPTNPLVYFSIGQLIPLFLITITVYKLLDPITKLRVQSNRLFYFTPNFFDLKTWINKLQLPPPFQSITLFIKYCVQFVQFRPVYGLLFISVFAVVFSSIIPSIPNFYKLPIIGYPVFWEVLSGLILIFLGFYFIKIISKSAKLNQHNYKQFFECILSIIDRRDEKELTNLARELIPSLKTLLYSGEKYELFYLNVQQLAWKKYKLNKKSVFSRDLDDLISKDEKLKRKVQLNEMQYYFFKIMGLISDKDFCRVVSMKVPEFSEEFFSIVNLKNLHFREQRSIFNNIIISSFEKEESILNRENQYDDGLMEVQILTQLIFENKDFLQQISFNSIVSPFRSSKLIKNWQIELYFSCLKVSLNLSFTVQCSQTLTHIHNGFLNLQDVILENILNEKIPFEQQLNFFSCVRHEIKRILNFLNENEDKVNEYYSNAYNLFPRSFDDDKKKKRHLISIYHVLAKSIFDFLIILSRIDIKTNDEQLLIRTAAVGFCMDSFRSNEKIDKILIEYIKFYIEDNDFNKKLDPPITQILISCFGLFYPQKVKGDWNALQIYLFDKLKKEFHTLYISDKWFAQKLLPFNVSYDPEKKMMTQTTQFRFTNERTLQCD